MAAAALNCRARHWLTGTAPAQSGSNSFTVVATDPSGNVRTQAYAMDVTGQAKTFTYDANGNMTSDGTRTFEWDARNQIAAVVVGTSRSEFAYDGQQQRVRAIEKQNGNVLTEVNAVFCGDDICEERASDGASVTRRVVQLGERIGTTTHLFATDHLGTVTEVTDLSGLSVRYRFDPWGRESQSGGMGSTAVGFTGHLRHHSGIALAKHRSYLPDLGRWISDDPLGPLSSNGDNLHRYVENRPTALVDPLGLQSSAGRLINYCMRHYYRNVYNSCPASEPKSDPKWSRDRVVSDGKYRSPDGSECKYDKCGQLLPDNGENYTFNFGVNPFTPTHITSDVLPRLVRRPLRVAVKCLLLGMA